MIQYSTTFSELNLTEILLKALDKLNFQTPSPIQVKTIPLMLQGKDIIAQAQTGTGKTAAFALPILQNLTSNTSFPQALILTPTRELAIQVAEQFKLFSTFQANINISVLCGGQDYRRQLQQLKAGAQIVVGTPGRILDHIDRGTLQLSQLRTFILDEADEMLRMGFIEDVELILSKIPDNKQIALFSATMPYRIKQIAQKYLKNPLSIEIKSETTTVKSIEQKFLFVPQAQKPQALIRILAVENFQGMIVFVRTKNSAEEVASFLQQYGHQAVAIHGDLAQSLREKIILQFRQGDSLNILVATDVAARGLDVDRITHVINYDMPSDCETYVHRIGRTGRAGRCGITILFVTPKEVRILKLIERHAKQLLEKISLPTEQMVQLAKQKQFYNKILERLSSPHIWQYKKLMENFFIENPNVEPTAVAAVLALLLNNDNAWLNNSLPQVNNKSVKSRKEVDNKKSKPPTKNPKTLSLQNRKSPSTYIHDNSYIQNDLFRIEVGKSHGAKPSNIIGAIANEAGLNSRFITELKIHEEFSTVRLPKNIPKEVFRTLTKAWVCGRQLKLTPVD